MGNIFGTIAAAGVNNWLAGQREEKARQANYMYGELSADNADARTRALYNDLYSPAAQIKQLKEAGLSPSIYASGGLAGKSGTSGAQGSSTAGIAPNVFGVSALDAAQIGLIKAQTNNINENTITVEIENGIKKLNATTFEQEWKLLNTTWYGNENGTMSWSDLANNSNDYEDFQNKVYDIIKNIDTPEALYVKSENGQKTLRNIYENNKKFSNDITVLTNSKENAELMLKITNLLNEKDFAEKSADAQIQQLKQITESAELTTEQKGAMNRLIDKMGHSTTSDIVLVLLMMLGQYSHANLNFGVSQSSQIKK